VYPRRLAGPSWGGAPVPPASRRSVLGWGVGAGRLLGRWAT